MTPYDDLSPMLVDHALQPRCSHSLPESSGWAMASDAAHGSSIRVALRIEDDRVVDGAFRAVGPLALIGCGSILLESVRGMPVQTVRGMRPRVLSMTAGLTPPSEWCAHLAVVALQRAMDDCEMRRRENAPTACGGSRQHRRARRPDRPPSREIDEQQYIFGILVNLLHYFELGQSARHIHLDSACKEREELLCDLMSIRHLIPRLPRPLRDVISLVGLQGLTLRQAGEKLGITNPAVHKRLTRAAAHIKSVWERGRIVPSQPGIGPAPTFLASRPNASIAWKSCRP